MRPFLNPLNLGGKRVVRAQDVFAATPYALDSSGASRVLPLPFVPRLSIHSPRSTSGSKVVLDSARQGFGLIPSSTAAQTGVASSLDGVTKGFPQLYNSPVGGLAVDWAYAEAGKFHKTILVTKGSGALDVDLSSLGIVGEVRAKSIDAAGNWYVWSRGVNQRYPGYGQYLNTTDGAVSSFPVSVSGTTLTLGAAMPSGRYILHCFAHDPSPDGLIQCGFFNGNGNNNGPEITLGWRPQFVELKGMSGTTVSSWLIADTARGIISGGANDAITYENTTASEVSLSIIDLTATGFKITNSSSQFNEAGNGTSYRAIREAA